MRHLLVVTLFAFGCAGQAEMLSLPDAGQPTGGGGGTSATGGGGGALGGGAGGGAAATGGSASSGGGSGGGGQDDAGVVTADAGTAGLPFVWTRAPVGTPVAASELTAVTDLYLDLLTRTRYFDVLDERVHGWPQSDPQHRYWYGTWWSGAGFDKTQGRVSIVHVDVGADNNGIGTSFVLESVCLSHALWPTPKLEQLARRLIRGLNSWFLAAQRMPNDPAGPMLARVGYPEPITSTDDGRTVFIDYSADRPGIDSYTLYVHLPTNPSWGDLWIKNKRSKDDIGHMLRAIGTLEDCAGGFGADTRADLAEMRANYVAWAQRVENDGWTIATLDQNAMPYVPPTSSSLSHYTTAGNAECTEVLALRLFSRGDPGTFACGSGIHPLEFLALGNASNGEILRSYHEAASRYALLTHRDQLAKDLLGGLVTRIEDGLTQAETNTFPVSLNAELLVKLIVNSANTGVPLTAREVRWVHEQVRRTHASYTALPPEVFRVFDPATPDGAYDFTPSADGIDFRFWAALAGTCSATYRNPASQPLLDCARLRAWTPPP